MSIPLRLPATKQVAKRAGSGQPSRFSQSPRTSATTRIPRGRDRRISGGFGALAITRGSSSSRPATSASASPRRDRMTQIGAWVDDTVHSWNEIHPVFASASTAGEWHRSGSRFGGSPPSAQSDNALAMCHTAGGSRCKGYNGVVAPPPEPHEGASTIAPPPGGGGKCDPPARRSASRRLRLISIAARSPTRIFKVVGSDPHGFDANGNHIGCEG